MNKENQIQIAISKENADIEPDVREFFVDLDCVITSNYIRKSTENLPMQIMVFLGGAVISGITWDLIKLGISKLFRKYPQINITIRDGSGIMFTVSKNGRVVVLVIPDRKKEFAHIRNIYGLGKYLVEETEEDKLEQRKRFDFVLGVVVAGILGLIINIFSNIFYDLFLTHKIQFSSYDPFYISILTSFLFLIIAFLQFLIYDYKNKLSLEKSFWKRYVFFLSEDFALSRFTRILNKVLISIFLIIFNLSILISLNNYSGFLIVLAVLIASVVFLILKAFVKRWFKK